MKKINKPMFVAIDGSSFEKEADCAAYEAASLPKLLAGLKADQLVDAFSRENTELADLLELAGDRCRKNRIAAGDLRRRRNGEAEAAPEAREPPAEAADEGATA